MAEGRKRARRSRYRRTNERASNEEEPEQARCARAPSPALRAPRPLSRPRFPQGERRKRGGGSTNSQKSDPTSYERTVPSPFMGEGGRRPGEGAPGPIAMTKWSCVERGTSKARSAALALPSPARWAPRPLSRPRFPQGERRKHAAAVLPALVCSSKPHANKLLPSPFMGEGGRRPGEGAPEPIPANERRRLKRGRVRAGSPRSRTPLLSYGHLGRCRGLDSHKGEERETSRRYGGSSIRQCLFPAASPPANASETRASVRVRRSVQVAHPTALHRPQRNRGQHKKGRSRARRARSSRSSR